MLSFSAIPPEQKAALFDASGKSVICSDFTGGVKAV
jgi:hypothetical protein